MTDMMTMTLSPNQWAYNRERVDWKYRRIDWNSLVRLPTICPSDRMRKQFGVLRGTRLGITLRKLIDAQLLVVPLV